MPRFSANLSLLFAEVKLAERFRKAAQNGFKAVEIQFPYALDLPLLQDRLSRYDLQLDLINLPAGDWASGERGIACLPGRQQEFRDGVSLAIRYATALGCDQINCLAGIRPQEIPESTATAVLEENLAFASARLGAEGLRLNIEPVNNIDVPGYFLTFSRQAAALIHRLALTNLYLQYDVYHMQIMEGNLVSTLRELLPMIGHIQIADTPGRHEPGTGEINFPFLLSELDRMGYTRRVALEYNPLENTDLGLSWLKDYFVNTEQGILQ